MNIEFSSVAEKDLKDACDQKKKKKNEDKRINIYKSGSCSCLLVAAAEHVVLNATTNPISATLCFVQIDPRLPCSPLASLSGSFHYFYNLFVSLFFG
jgi:hypothetical protein